MSFIGKPVSTFPGHALSRRRDAQDTSVRIVGREPERAVGPLAYVADALAQTLQQALLAPAGLAVELEPHQRLPGKRADEQVAAPGREHPGAIERHPGRRD